MKIERGLCGLVPEQECQSSQTPAGDSLALYSLVHNDRNVQYTSHCTLYSLLQNSTNVQYTVHCTLYTVQNSGTVQSCTLEWEQ